MPAPAKIVWQFTPPLVMTPAARAEAAKVKKERCRDQIFALTTPSCPKLEKPVKKQQ